MSAIDSERKENSETRIGQEEVRRKLPEVVDRAREGERLIVTRHDRDQIVILGIKQYEQLRALEQEHATAADAA